MIAKDYYLNSKLSIRDEGKNHFLSLNWFDGGRVVALTMLLKEVSLA